MTTVPHPDGTVPGIPASGLDSTPSGWAGAESGSSPWMLCYDGFDPAVEGLREALCTVGNGYWATRGAAPEADADAVHYPGTYLAGVYNRVRTDRARHSVEDEHMVNAPNWLPLWFRVADGGWFRPGSARILGYRQELDLRRGVLTRVVRFCDDAGRTTKVSSLRFVSHAAPHVALLSTTFEAEDWSGPVTVRSAINGRVANRNVTADRLLPGTHLMPGQGVELDGETVLLDMETSQSGIHIATGARTRVFDGDALLSPDRRFLRDDAGWVAHEFNLALKRGHPIRVEKPPRSTRPVTALSPPPHWPLPPRCAGSGMPTGCWPRTNGNGRFCGSRSRCPCAPAGGNHSR